MTGKRAVSASFDVAKISLVGGNCLSIPKSCLRSYFWRARPAINRPQRKLGDWTDEKAVAGSSSVGGLGGWTRGSGRSGAQSPRIHPASGSASAELYRLLC